MIGYQGVILQNLKLWMDVPTFTHFGYQQLENRSENCCIRRCNYKPSIAEIGGGVSATQVVGGEAFTSKKLYYPVGSEVLSFERPYFNSRGGDALRGISTCSLARKNQLDVAYHTDLELETEPELTFKLYTRDYRWTNEVLD